MGLELCNYQNDSVCVCVCPSVLAYGGQRTTSAVIPQILCIMSF